MICEEEMEEEVLESGSGIEHSGKEEVTVARQVETYEMWYVYKEHSAFLVVIINSDHGPPLLRPENMVSLPSSCLRLASAPGLPSTQASCSEAQLEDCPVDNSILWEKPRKDGPDHRSKEEKDMVRGMADMVSSCPCTASIPGFPSPHLSKEVKLEREPNMVDLMPSFPRVAGTLGFPSLECQVKECTINIEAIWERPPNGEKKLKEDTELIKHMVALVPSCPTAARIPGFPSAPHPKAEVDLSMLSLVPACPKMSSLPGFASTDGATTLEWLVDPKPMFEHLQKKKKEDEESILLNGKSKEDIGKTNAMVALVPCCTEAARIPSFRSAPRPKRELNSVDLTRSCPKISSLPGFPSTAKVQTGDWHVEQKPLFEKTLKDKTVIIKDRLENMKNMVALVPSCPCDSLTSGFPSFT
ncbi:unnamed protein product [Coregonus sp. 'balchen']|nr:unnamed protein product [Coregonus sp. 'balchen']